MITQKDLHDLMQKEFATTLKVMRAYPADKPDYTPHERSNTAARLMATFVIEMKLIQRALGDDVDFRALFGTYKPDIPTAIADFEKEVADVLPRMAQLSDEDYMKPIEFAGKELPAHQILLMMTLDQIHHRGQLSTYIRPAGGLVPSIYGPSADDKSTNL